MKSIFVTGTDTDVGKTIASSWLALHWNASYWKPIQSGVDMTGVQPSDRQIVEQLAHCTSFPECYLFKAAVSPHEAARQENVAINLREISLPAQAESDTRLVVEGAGGLLAPLNHRDSIAELILHLKLSTIVVARSSVGTINHTRLTIEAAQRRNIHILGVIMVGPSNPSNQNAIEQFANVQVLATLPKFDTLNYETLKSHAMPASLLKLLNS